MTRVATTWRAIKRSRYYYALFALPLAYYVIFHYLPMFGVMIAFKNFNVVRGIIGSPWVGLKYFNDFLTDRHFYKVFANTLVLGWYEVMFIFPAPIILALLLNEVNHTVFKRIVQSISYLPHFLSTVVVVGMLVNFLEYTGVVNQLLAAVGVQPVHFLLLPEWFRSIYISSGVWQTIGWGSIIYLAGLAGVNPELYEAAMIDGAGRWKRLLHVTIPGILPIITIMLIFNIGGILTVSFEKILLMQNGSNYATSDVIQTYVYRRGLIGADYGYATAVGLFNSLIALLFLTTANWTSRKFSETSLW